MPWWVPGKTAMLQIKSTRENKNISFKIRSKQSELCINKWNLIYLWVPMYHLLHSIPSNECDRTFFRCAFHRQWSFELRILCSFYRLWAICPLDWHSSLAVHVCLVTVLSFHRCYRYPHHPNQRLIYVRQRCALVQHVMVAMKCVP